MLGTALRKIVSKYSASYKTGEELGAPGKPVPQPIGWAPGRTPPPVPAPPGTAQSSTSRTNAEGDGEEMPTLPSQPSAKAMSGRSGSLGGTRAPAPSLATVPEDPSASQESVVTPTKG